MIHKFNLCAKFNLICVRYVFVSHNVLDVTMFYLSFNLTFELWTHCKISNGYWQLRR